MCVSSQVKWPICCEQILQHCLKLTFPNDSEVLPQVQKQNSRFRLSREEYNKPAKKSLTKRLGIDNKAKDFYKNLKKVNINSIVYSCRDWSFGNEQMKANKSRNLKGIVDFSREIHHTTSYACVWACCSELLLKLITMSQKGSLGTPHLCQSPVPEKLHLLPIVLITSLPENLVIF